jgi:hypothetical protein
MTMTTMVVFHSASLCPYASAWAGANVPEEAAKCLSAPTGPRLGGIGGTARPPSATAPSVRGDLRGGQGDSADASLRMPEVGGAATQVAATVAQPSLSGADCAGIAP